MKKISIITALICIWLISSAFVMADENLVAYWKFDEGEGTKALDSVSKIEDDILRTFWYFPGVSGTGLKADGFTTHIIREAEKAPKLKDGLTIEAWIAPQAYPYNWCAIVNQEKDHKAGYFFGIDNWARVGLHVAVDGQWVECNTKREMVPFMTDWTHIVGTVDKNKGLAVYVNGELAGLRELKGQLTFSDDMPLQIARNHKKTFMDPETLVRTEVNYPTSYSFDGIIDELKIYDRAFSVEEVQNAYSSSKPDDPPALKWRKLPEIPASDNFGAYYSNLEFYPEWDLLWRVSEHPDIVVTFDEGPYSMVFWRGTNYNMNLVTENGKWVADQSAEGGGGDVEGCCEHMSDKQNRYAYVRIIENNDARVVVHWRYAVVDVQYRIANLHRSQMGAWADEYYYIYPDGVAVRAVTVYNMNGRHSTTEPASLNNPGERAEDNLEIDALIVANMEGEIRRQYWDPWPSSGEAAAPFTNDLPNANINIVNFKSKSKPFYIYEPGTRVIPYGGGLNELRPYSKFPTWNHWPVGQAPSDGRYAFFTDRVASSAVTSPEPSVEVDEDGTSHGRFIMGLTDQPIEKLAPIARAWLQPPDVIVKAGYRFDKYSGDQRAFLFTKEDSSAGKLEFKVSASDENPLVNPAFVITNWGGKKAKLMVDGNQITDKKTFRQGTYKKLEGSDLIVFLKSEIFEPVTITIAPAD
ncbi:MAG: LamG domain-containing protein [Planctomycetota bacterium]